MKSLGMDWFDSMIPRDLVDVMMVCNCYVERLCCWLVRHQISGRQLDGIPRKAVESQYNSKFLYLR